MKNFCILLSLLLVACSKNDQTLKPNSSIHSYTLDFQLENEAGGFYFVQKSNDGSSFVTVDSIPYDPQKSGNYTYDISLKTNEFVRVGIGSNSNTITLYSDTLKAD